MLHLILINTLLLFFFSTQANAASFEGLTHLSTSVISGEVTVYCSGDHREKVVHYNCQQETLDPANFMYFVHDEYLDANFVILKSTWENGKVRIKKKIYNAGNQRTLTQTNIWVDSLFQSKLLNYGLNTVEYTFKKNNTDVKSGSFQVFVQQGINRKCKPSSYHTLTPIDCRNKSVACRQYFSNENYCRDYTR